MSVRRRNIRERVERERRLKAGYDALTLSLQQIQDAITAARARGETTCTDQFLREAFGARMETGPAHAVIVPTIPISKEDEQTVDKLMKRLGDSVKRRIADDGKLWAMHVPGPDDVFACESKAAAEQRVKEHNDAIRKLDLARQFGMEPGTVEARVIEWPHSAESHAESLRDGVADTL